MTLPDSIAKRILILDGAMGTMIQTYGLAEADFRGQAFAGSSVLLAGDNDALNIAKPEVVRDIHCRYLRAGADIITTNTFSSQTISQADYKLEAYARAMATEGARIARQAADEFSTPQWPRYVAGSVGPTNRTLSISPDVGDPAARELDYPTLLAAYIEQIGGLLEGGVDAILIETIFDTLNAKAAIDAAVQAMAACGRQVPIMLSATISDMAGRTLSGQTIDAFLASVSSFPLFSVGLNCGFGARQMLPYLRQMAAAAPHLYISVHPNAGLPNSLGLYDETPESMAEDMKVYASEGIANIIGGCCGTTDEFIAKIREVCQAAPTPAPRTAAPAELALSGLEAMPRAKFVNVGERCNVAGSRKFLRLVGEHAWGEALAIARKQVEDGAMVIDINMDDGLLDARQEMTTFLRLIASEPEIARVPVMIDSSDWEVIIAGLQQVQGKPIVNSISLKEGEDVFLSHARDVVRYGAAVVVMCFDEQGQATTFERRTEIAARAYKLLTERVGMAPQDIIFDPNVLAVATGMDEHADYALDFIRATGWIRQHLPLAHVSGGVSNLSFAFRGNTPLREAMHAVFLYHAIAEGMDFGIVNPATRVQYADIPAPLLEAIDDVLLNRRSDATERLTAMAATSGLADKSDKSEPGADAPALPLEARLKQALIRGIADNMPADIEETLAKYPRAVDIIEGPLMDGMNAVGELFGSGKMFLPQVVKAARTMKAAVALLDPHIKAQKDEAHGPAGRVVLATVKGDVHDIGKNIVGVVMACGGYDVEDLGVMVPTETVVEKAIETKADIVGLSGLITPSLAEMVAVAKAMERRGLSIPIMIGGATTSAMHVALKIAPEYSGTVVWVKDASQNPLIAAKLLGQGAQEYSRQVKAEQARLREQYAASRPELLTIDEARKRKPQLFKS